MRPIHGLGFLNSTHYETAIVNTAPPTSPAAENAGTDYGSLMRRTLRRAAPASKDARILIVDDDALIVDLFRAYLQDDGYTDIVTTSDSVSALSTISLEQPSLVLLDLMMPVVTGTDILEALRDSPDADIPVIVLTATTE